MIKQVPKNNNKIILVCGIPKLLLLDPGNDNSSGSAVWGSLISMTWGHKINLMNDEALAARLYAKWPMVGTGLMHRRRGVKSGCQIDSVICPQFQEAHFLGSEIPMLISLVNGV